MTNQLTIQDRVFGLEKEFNQVNAYMMNFAKEAQFALQLLHGSDSLVKAAQQNPAALEYALINIASIGISLNPALKEAYLVPRGGKICLDPSYIGLVKLATDTGAIEWVQAEIVKEKDDFQYQGVGKAPIHKMNPFGDRGAIIGVYCVAKLSTGEHLSTIMSKADCDAIRDKSSQASKSGPWVSFYEEMLKKTVIKRAAKLWPRSERLLNAVEVSNEIDGIDFKDNSPHVRAESLGADAPTGEQMIALSKRLLEARRTDTELLAYLAGRFPKDKPESLDSLTGAQYVEAMAALDSIIEKSKKVTA
jgi:recombination protein RecT